MLHETFCERSIMALQLLAGCWTELNPMAMTGE
jgi:hypothetical protein